MPSLPSAGERRIIERSRAAALCHTSKAGASLPRSGGSSDDAVLVIAHLEGRIVVIDLVVKQVGGTPFNPRDAIRQFAAIHSTYRIFFGFDFQPRCIPRRRGSSSRIHSHSVPGRNILNKVPIAAAATLCYWRAFFFRVCEPR